MSEREPDYLDGTDDDPRLADPGYPFATTGQCDGCGKRDPDCGCCAYCGGPCHPPTADEIKAAYAEDAMVDEERSYSWMRGVTRDEQSYRRWLRQEQRYDQEQVRQIMEEAST